MNSLPIVPSQAETQFHTSRPKIALTITLLNLLTVAYSLALILVILLLPGHGNASIGILYILPCLLLIALCVIFIRKNSAKAYLAGLYLMAFMMMHMVYYLIYSYRLRIMLRYMIPVQIAIISITVVLMLMGWKKFNARSHQPIQISSVVLLMILIVTHTLAMLAFTLSLPGRGNTQITILPSLLFLLTAFYIHKKNEKAYILGLVLVLFNLVIGVLTLSRPGSLSLILQYMDLVQELLFIITLVFIIKGWKNFKLNEKL